MPYQPDPAVVRECATRIIASEIDSIRDLGQADIGEMCEEEIVAIQEPLGGWDALGADKAADALIDAVRADIKAATISHSWADRFPTVTICGSMRFFPRMLEVAAELTSAGRIVLMPHDASLTGIPDKTASEHGAMLDEMHRRKIDRSGSVYIVNTGGYVGESTRGEIEYAAKLGLTVRYDEDVHAVSGGAQ
jgi:hypothetical protein